MNLSFQPSAPYDAIELALDGVVIASLPGNSASYRHRPGQLGAHTYTLSGIQHSVRSLPAGCSVLFVSPAASPVLSLTCNERQLSWTPGANYDAITVLRDGVEIATLPGSASSFTDSERTGAAVVLYTVVGSQEAFRSPDVHCLDPGIWIMEIGDVQVPVNADRILVPVYVTNSYLLENFDCHLDIDWSRLEYLRDRDLALGGTVTHPDSEQVFMGIGLYRLPSVGIIFDAFPPPNPEKKIPVNLRQLVYNFAFRPTAAFADGETLNMSIKEGSLGINEDPARGVHSLSPQHLSGQLRFGSAGPAAVRQLDAAIAPVAVGQGGGGAAGRDVHLTWRNGDVYERVRVERSGLPIAELAGGAEAFSDNSVAPGVFTYKVIGEKGNQRSFPTSTLVTTVSPRGTFLRCDANRDGRINITDPTTVLNHIFRGGGKLPCEDAADADDDGQISITDAVTMLQYLFLARGVVSAPGTANPWFDPTPDTLGCEG